MWQAGNKTTFQTQEPLFQSRKHKDLPTAQAISLNVQPLMRLRSNATSATRSKEKSRTSNAQPFGNPHIFLAPSRTHRPQPSSSHTLSVGTTLLTLHDRLLLSSSLLSLLTASSDPTLQPLSPTNLLLLALQTLSIHTKHRRRVLLQRRMAEGFSLLRVRSEARNVG